MSTVKSALPIMDGNTLLITSPFSYRVDPITGQAGTMHKGIDLTLWLGWSALSYINAAADGIVAAVGYDGSRGNWVKIDHGQGVTTQYFHMQDKSITVSKGYRVSGGQTIGYMGSTGRSTGAHLHFQVEINGQPVDPLPYLQGKRNLIERNTGNSNSPGEDEGGNIPEDWAKSAVQWARSVGLMVGDEHGNLHLHEGLTRQQFCVMARRLHDMIVSEVK